jgi:hypothetical protein
MIEPSGGVAEGGTGTGVLENHRMLHSSFEHVMYCISLLYNDMPTSILWNGGVTARDGGV